MDMLYFAPCSCTKWVHEPAIVFDIPYVPRPGEGNPFHILNDGVMRIHSTLAQVQPFIISPNGCGHRRRLSNVNSSAKTSKAPG